VTVGLMHALAKAGADIIELGVPFSDPMADGPVIQLACERALKHGTGLWDIIDMVAEFRKTDSDTPVVLSNELQWVKPELNSLLARQHRLLPRAPSDFKVQDTTLALGAAQRNQQFAATFFQLFAGLTLLMAVGGIVAVTQLNVKERDSEFG
ncbi:MAG: tryptophan synthase subunit alpha, partial [Pseudomonadota bacterium]